MTKLDINTKLSPTTMSIMSNTDSDAQAAALLSAMNGLTAMQAAANPSAKSTDINKTTAKINKQTTATINTSATFNQNISAAEAAAATVKNQQTQLNPTATQLNPAATQLNPALAQYNLTMYANLSAAAQGVTSPTKKFELLYAAEHAKAMATLSMQQAAIAAAYANATQQPQNNTVQGMSNSINMSNTEMMRNMMPPFGMPVGSQMNMANLAAHPYLSAMMQGSHMNPAIVPQPQGVVNTKNASKPKPRRKRPAASKDTAKKKPKSVPKGKADAKPKAKSRSSGKICQVENCTKLARSTTLFCAAHGGGRRCQRPLCTKSARGATNFCIAHGGGRRCKHVGCTKSAQGSTHFCIAHGGGRRCKQDGCEKSARGPKGFCKTHGGGKRCAQKGCYKMALENSLHCKPHMATQAVPLPATCQVIRSDVKPSSAPKSVAAQGIQTTVDNKGNKGPQEIEAKTVKLPKSKNVPNSSFDEPTTTLPQKSLSVKVDRTLSGLASLADGMSKDNIVPLSAIKMTQAVESPLKSETLIKPSEDKVM